MTATRAKPASKATIMIAVNKAGQYVGHFMHRELPKERLKPALHFPHRAPDLLKAH